MPFPVSIALTSGIANEISARLFAFAGRSLLTLGHCDFRSPLIYNFLLAR